MRQGAVTQTIVSDYCVARMTVLKAYTGRSEVTAGLMIAHQESSGLGSFRV